MSNTNLLTAEGVSNRAKSKGVQAGCDLCGCRRFELMSDHDRRGELLATVVCWRCGLVQHSAIPTDQQLEEYYEKKYRKDYNREETPSPRRVVREWKRGQERFEGLKPFLKSGDEVFEIGSGIGCNLKHFELSGYEASGIEPGAGFCRFSHEQMHCNVQQKVLEDLPALPRCDVALLVHVLEHLNSPTRALKHIRQMLRPGGRLYVEVPNLAAPHSSPKKMFHFAHIYNFTPWTLAMAGRASGFEVTEVLSQERDRNLKMVFTKSENFTLEIEPQSYLKAVEAIRRYNTLTYHLRYRYVAERIGEVVERLTERSRANENYQQILDLCAKLAADKNAQPLSSQKRAA